MKKVMNTAIDHKNIGLMLFVFACAIVLMAGIGVNGQGRGNSRGGYESRKSDTYRDDQYRRRNGGYYPQQDDRYNGRDRRGNQSLRFAFDRGYREGLKDGRRAARGDRRDRNGYYGNGNRNGWGRDREWQYAYDRGYREGFEDGYNRSRRNDGRYDRDRRYGNRTIFGIPLPY